MPVYPGATVEINSGADAPGVALAGSPAAPPADHDVDVESYSDVKTAIYQTSDSPSQVLDWYRSNMASWQEHWSSATGGGTATALATAIWTKDSGKEAAWMAASTQGGMTILYLWSGS
ncbi:MAG: hypothetical protein ABSG55_02980 [Dehalococcoidia bacterium]